MSEKADAVTPVSFRAYIKEMRETYSVLQWMWNELIGREGKRWSLWMAGAILAMTLLFTLQPLFFSWAVNAIRDREAQILIMAGAAFVSAAVLHHGAGVVQDLLREYAWNRNMRHLQMRIHELFCEKSLGQHTGEGDALNYSTIHSAKGRVETVQQMILFDSGSMLVGVLFSFALLWTLGWEIGLAATVLVVIHLSWSLYLNYYVARDTDEIEQGFRAFSRQLNERWEKITRVKTSGKNRPEYERLSRWFESILDADRRFWFWFIRQAGMRDTVALLIRLLIICYGAYLVYRGEWQVGTLIPLYAWTTEVSQNLWFIGHMERRLNQQVPYIRSMKKALTIAPAFSETEGAVIDGAKSVAIEFDRVGLCYGSGTHPILRDVSFRIAPGEKIALIGPSGAGKTTVMKLLLRYLDPSSGEIRLNGRPLRELNLSSWMERVGYIAQQPEIFDGTIRYNMTFGLSAERQAALTDDEIWQVMRDLQIDFGSRLSEGLDTKVGKDGMKLSGGQAQRLIIGAAVIKDPAFMIIDEATSSLDSSTERLVQEGLEKSLARGVGALIVAHRLSTVRHLCDRFIVLRPLEEVEEGESQIDAEAASFEELYERSLIFRKLAEDQLLLLKR